MWTSFGSKDVKGTIKRIGLNFGAVGDRKAENGTLWLEYPSIGGVFHRHSSPSPGHTTGSHRPA